MKKILIPLLFLAILGGFAKEKNKANSNPAWPPREGIKTPGVQIPFSKLKTEADWKLEGPPDWLYAQGPVMLVPLAKRGELSRIAGRDNKISEFWKVGQALCGGLIEAFSHLWLPDCGAQQLHKVNPRDGKIIASIPLRFAPGAKPALAANADSIWTLSDEAGTLSRLDPANNRILHEIRVSAGCNSIHFEQEMLWITCPSENRLVQVNPRTNLVEKRIETAASPHALTFGEGHLWVLGGKEGKISKIDPKTAKEIAIIETGVPGATGSLAFGDGALWVSQPGYPLTRIDARTNKLLQQFAGEGGAMVRFAAGSLWLLDSNKLLLQRFDPRRVALTLPD